MSLQQLQRVTRDNSVGVTFGNKLQNLGELI